MFNQMRLERTAREGDSPVGEKHMPQFRFPEYDLTREIGSEAAETTR
jgi:hypothetical protein